jgi:hypothetical protein
MILQHLEVKTSQRIDSNKKRQNIYDKTTGGWCGSLKLIA